jgi:CHAT domain-containing protein
LNWNGPFDDPHTPYITALLEDNDWAGLICYFVAHGYSKALDAVIECLPQQKDHDQKQWHVVHEFLSDVRLDPLSFERQPPIGLPRGLSKAENASIELLILYPCVQLCNFTNMEPNDSRQQILQLGIEAGQQALIIAELVQDDTLSAFLVGVVARAHLELKDFDVAHEMYYQAVCTYRRLAEKRPEIYLSLAGTALNNLGCVQRALGQFHEARESHVEALIIRRELAALNLHEHLPNVAVTLHNLGAMESDLNHNHAAHEYYTEALNIRRQLVRQDSGDNKTSLRNLSNTLTNLGLVQHELGDLEDARISFLKSLEIRRKLAKEHSDLHSSSVAAVLFNLGNLQQDLNDPENACESYTEVLVTYRQLEQLFPDQYEIMIANVLNNLGVAQSDLYNLEDARQSLLEALEIQRRSLDKPPDTCRVDLAMTLANLGAIERDLGHLEAAREKLFETVAIWRKLDEKSEKHRYFLGIALNNLGVVQHDLGDLEDALKSHQEALAIRKDLVNQHPALYQSHLGVTYNNLGTVQRDLSDLDGASRSHRQALKIRRELTEKNPDAHTHKLAITLNNLGIVQYERCELEDAHRSYFESIQIHQKLVKSHPDIFYPSLAAILNNLGMVQQALIELESARDSYRSSYGIRKDLAKQRPEVYRPLVATTLKNLGTVEHELNDLQGARRCYLKALNIYRQLAKKRPDIYQPFIASCHNNLGTVRRDSHYFQDARRSLLKALAIYRHLAKEQPDIYRSYVAASLNNLGLVENDLQKPDNALQCFQESAELYSRITAKDSPKHLDARLRCWANLGRCYLQKCDRLGLPDYRKACEAFRQARDCVELLRGRFTVSRQRRRVLHECLEVYERLAATYVDISRMAGDENSLWEAVEAAEASKTRALTELLSGEMIEPAGAPQHLVGELRILRRDLQHAENRLWDVEHRAMSELQQPGSELQHVSTETIASQQVTQSRTLEIDVGLCQQIDVTKHVESFRDQVKHLRRSYQKLIDEIQRKYDSQFNPDVPIVPIAREAIQWLVPTDKPTAIVEYCLTQDRGFALIITCQGLRVVELRELNDATALEWAQAWFRDYYANRNAAADNYSQKKQWEQALPRLLEPVSRRAIQPVVDALAGGGIRRLILAPNRALHIFPLHACLLHDGRYLADAYEVTYIPSLSVFDRCANRKRKDTNRLLLVENPTYDLMFTEIEGARMRRIYPEHVTLYGNDANKKQFLQDSIHCNIFHYCGHVKFEPRDPLRSGLILHSKHNPDHWLSLRDIFCELHMPGNRLTVLNGCESGMLLPDQLDEYVGLPSGFLFAGAVCVLSTLWSINDISSTLLIDRFHREWRLGKPVGTALHEAQHWLRKGIVNGEYLSTDVFPGFIESLEDENMRDYCEKVGQHYARAYPVSPPFSSPVYWAPFVAIGLACPVEACNSHHGCA